MRSLLGLLLLCACTAPEDDGPARPGETSGATDPTTTVETLTDTDPTDTDTTPTDTGDPTDTTPTEPAEEYPKSCSSLYDQDIVPVVSFDIAPEDWSGFASDCRNYAQNYRPVTVTWDGEVVSAKARLKGNWSWSCDKYQFVLSFNEDDPAGRFHGVRKTMLDAPWYDQTFLHERVGFSLFEARGLPYSCVNNARLIVNGSDYGVYSNVERIDEEYLERHYEEKDGDLYQAGTELKTNEDTADSTRIDALHAAQTVDEIAALVNLDQAVAEWAMEAMIPALDNYWAGVEINYYLYDHPSRGFEYLPYDLDISFGDTAYTDGSLVWPDALTVDPITWQHSGWGKEALVMTVLSDPAWCARFVEEVAAARAVYDADALVARLDTYEAQIADAVAGDRRKPFSTEAHTASVADLRAFFAQRAQVVDDWLAVGGHCPARW